MKLKKILFSVFCAAILLCTGVVCLASADNGGISTCSVSDYDYDDSYNGVSLRIRGYSAAPASLSQVVNKSTYETNHFAEVDVSRYNTRSAQYEDTDGDNAVVKYGKTLTGSIGQDRYNTYRYEHSIVLHIGDVLVSPIVKNIYKEYFF